MTVIASISYGQVYINEFSASNDTQIEDTINNNFADWIELYNAGNENVNLKGYYLTDNYNNPDKWEVPADLIIEAKGYLLIWADGENANNHASFKLSAEGEGIALYSTDIELIDSISFGVQRTDISMGRDTDGSSNWCYFIEATPNASNTTNSYKGFTDNVPDFNLRGGFYTSEQSVTLFTDMGGDIHYTLDGSQPLLSSSKYSAPININKTTIIRARVIKSGLIPGPTVTQSYFINENSVDDKLPVVSIATESANFWDSLTGIYVQNFKPAWEIPINIELFENNGSDRAAFNERAGCKVNGLWSWQLPQKMLGIYFRKRYDSGNLDYPITSQRVRNSYKSFSLRASGSDWSYTLFRDMLGHHSTLLNMDIDIMGYKPSIVYVNGQYMGIHNIREKVDDDYIEKSYAMESGTFDLVENEVFPEAGDLDAYKQLEALLDKDLSNDANFNAVANTMDIENFTDFVITEIAVANTSINHNVMAWKPKSGGLWRWILMDVDRGFFNPDEHLLNFYRNQSVWPFGKLLTNSGYSKYFAKRLADHLFTSFNPERMKSLITEHKKHIEAEIPHHVDRWLGTTSGYGDAMPSVDYWIAEVNDLISFVEQRPQELLNDLSNYGYSETINLSLKVLPAHAGSIKLNGLTVPGSECNGSYINNALTEFKAEYMPGYNFVGWTEAKQTLLIQKGSMWKYLDTGVNLGNTWVDSSFNDLGWSSGKGQLGYGDDDETTVVSFGPDANNKHMTTYFRKDFTITNDLKDINSIVVNLLCDDGAIVYLNGNEIIRHNINTGESSYQMPASATVSGNEEDEYNYYLLKAENIVAGTNTIAVEVHQFSANSSDLSFDMELAGIENDKSDFISTDNTIDINISGDLFLIANYNLSGDCIIPDTLVENTTLNKACSPYLAQGDVFIPDSVTLTIEPGVEVWMPEGANVWVHGKLMAQGTYGDSIVFKLNPNVNAESWGALLFKYTGQSSELNFVTIENASQGPDPVLDKAAISAYYADLILDNITILNVKSNPIAARYSDITLKKSRLHSKVTGDCINVKYGKARVENCEFIGNNQPDTDAIDYDEIEDGIIKNCVISNFKGFNSDAIDIGEEAHNISIDSIIVYNITDKGISIGQRSTATIQNGVFINCNKGIALKDSSNALINRCLFYSTVDAVACYEKNVGRAGGNAMVTNSILSNTSNCSLYKDSKSTLQSQYCLTDFNSSGDYPLNMFGNPYFAAPTFFNFNLESNSSAINAGLDNNTSIDLGTLPFFTEFEPGILISQFFVDPDNLGLPEFITLFNPSDKAIDLSGYKITKGVTLSIPEGVIIEATDILYLTNNSNASNWWQQSKQVIEWQSGKLSNNGEAMQLEDNHGIVIDYINYQNDGLWPQEAFYGKQALQLKSNKLDNHFPENWRVSFIDEVLDTNAPPASSYIRIFPNPTNGQLTIQSFEYKNQVVKIYNYAGQLVLEFYLDSQGGILTDLSDLPSGLYVIKIADKTQKVIKR